VRPRPADERSHAPGDDPAWTESWSFEFFTANGLGGYVTLTVFPRRRAAWYWAYVVGEGAGPVAVIDEEAPLPRPPGTLEVRTEGLWADHICETPLDHWTVGNEAFAVRFDDPAEALGRQRGERVPLGFDLEWETDAPILDRDDGYAVPCRVHGLVLLDRSRLDVDGFGWRDHRWGRLDWQTKRMAGRLDDGTWFTEGFAVAIDAAERAPVPADGVAVERSLARVRASDGRPGRAWLTNPAG
jgi:hypothetical protein